MCYQAEALPSYLSNQHTLGCQAFSDSRGGERVCLLPEIEEDHVGERAAWINDQAWDLSQPPGEAFCSCVVFLETVNHALQGHDTGRGDDAGLTHAAAQLLSYAVRPSDEFVGAA